MIPEVSWGSSHSLGPNLLSRLAPQRRCRRHLSQFCFAPARWQAAMAARRRCTPYAKKLPRRGGFCRTWLELPAVTRTSVAKSEPRTLGLEDDTEYGVVRTRFPLAVWRRGEQRCCWEMWSSCASAYAYRLQALNLEFRRGLLGVGCDKAWELNRGRVRIGRLNVEHLGDEP